MKVWMDKNWLVFTSQTAKKSTGTPKLFFKIFTVVFFDKSAA